MLWTWIERLSWISGIVGVLSGVLSAWVATRAGKGTTRVLAQMLSVAMDKPEVLKAVEEDARRTAAGLKRRARIILGISGGGLALAAAAGVLALLAVLLPDFGQPEASGGDQPHVAQECTNANEASVCVGTDHWTLSSSRSRIETIYGGVNRKAEKHGKARMKIQASGCTDSGEVRWNVIVDSNVAAQGVAGAAESQVEFDIIKANQGFRFIAERVNEGNCDIDLQLRPIVSFD